MGIDSALSNADNCATATNQRLAERSETSQRLAERAVTSQRPAERAVTSQRLEEGNEVRTRSMRSVENADCAIIVVDYVDIGVSVRRRPDTAGDVALASVGGVHRDDAFLIHDDSLLGIFRRTSHATHRLHDKVWL